MFFDIIILGTLKQLPQESRDSTLSVGRRAALRKDILEAINRLDRFSKDLDPVKQPLFVLDPSEPREIGRFIAQTLLQQPRHRLDGIDQFYGSGVYALYYTGAFDVYGPVSGTECPIYVGKADPKTVDAKSVEEQGVGLHRRLKDHLKSIGQAENLDVADFECRHLVVSSSWQNTAEDFLISRFKPIWNNEIGICFGFGKHGDSPTTRSNTRSPWDTLHPGRPWATRRGNIPNPKSVEDIKEAIRRHFTSNPPSA